MRMQMAGLMAASLLLSVSVQAKSAPEWKEQGNAYKQKNVLPVKTMAVGAVNVDVGVHLERLTLLSGEGHTGKKVFSGLLAGAATVAGLGGGIDFASREPLEEHLTAEEAKKIADDVEQLVAERFRKMDGIKVLAGPEVTSQAFYSGLAGLADLDSGKKRVQDGRWSPEYYFGYYSTPAGGYKYRKASKFAFSDKEFSPVIRKSLAADATVQVNLFLANTRGDFRIQEMTVSLSGQPWANQKNGDLITLSYVLTNPNDVSVAMDKKSKDNYAAWLELKPQFIAQLDSVTTKMRAALPAFQPDPAMAIAPVAPASPVAEVAPVAAVAPAVTAAEVTPDAPVAAEAVSATAEPAAAVEETPATHK